MEFVKHMWYRGCLLIIKKFKFFKLRDQQQQIEHGKGCKSKWTFGGYKPRGTGSGAGSAGFREDVSDLRWDSIEKLDKDSFGR